MRKMTCAMDVWDCIEESREKAECFVIITIAAQRGSVPSELGAKAVVDAHGLKSGNLGGGKVEAQAIRHAQALMKEAAICDLKVWNLQRDIGMTCGGEMTLLFEIMRPENDWHVLIFGAGHVSQALVRLLLTLRCRIDVVDERAEWLEKLPTAPKLRVHPVARFEDGVDLATSRSFVVTITKGHGSDRPVLGKLLRKLPKPVFVGAIGSNSKRAVLFRELRDEGIPDESLEQIVCPLGLPIGGNDPAEIAVSIAAQLLEKRGR
jgi:xanthine dehydrogenase accessory factor